MSEHSHSHAVARAAWRPDFRPWHWPQLILLALIWVYQHTFSLLMPPNTCRFYPTCSHYGFEAIQKYGAIRGGLMAAWRVVRCNPFNPGGYDPVP